MKSWSHPDPESAAPGEIVGIYPFTLSAEESELIHNQLFAADQDFAISHYTKEKYFAQLLESSAFSAQRLDLYDDDPLEGLYPEANKEALAHADAQLMEQMHGQRDYKAFLESQAIHRTHCWFGIPQEDAKMWDDYGDDGRGVCIISSTHRLLGAVAPDAAIFCELGKVTYWPEDKPLPDLHSSTVMFRKRPKFSTENEVRLLAQMEHLPTDADGSLLPCSERLAIKIDLSTLVTAVILGPSMSTESQRKMIEQMCLKVPQAKIVRSRFDVRP